MKEHFLESTDGMGVSFPATGSAAGVDQQEAALVKASQHGDEQAFARLVQLHQRRVFNLVYRMLNNYEEASEITQETFLAAWQGLPAFRGDARFSTWLYRIAYNCCVKQLEARKKDRALQEAMLEEQFLHSGYEDALGEACARDDQTVVRENVSRLPAKYRIVLILRHLQEMSYEEMAEILTVPIGTIKTHLFRARSLLKERLESFWKHRGDQ